MTPSNPHPPEAQNVADSRALFEKWAISQGRKISTVRNPLLNREDYNHVGTAISWYAWQARDPEIEALRAQVLPEREVLVKLLAAIPSEVDMQRLLEFSGLDDVELLQHKMRVYGSAIFEANVLLSHMQRHAGEGETK